jgi:hypothetical protein
VRIREIIGIAEQASNTYSSYSLTRLKTTEKYTMYKRERESIRAFIMIQMYERKQESIVVLS